MTTTNTRAVALAGCAKESKKMTITLEQATALGQQELFDAIEQTGIRVAPEAEGFYTVESLQAIVDDAKRVLGYVQRDAERWAREQTDPGDNALSNWANGISRDKALLGLRIVLLGGLFPKWELIDTATGTQVHASRESGEYGDYWMCLGERGYGTGLCFPVRQHGRKAVKQEKFGVHEGWVMRVCKPDVGGSGRGLSGNAWACATTIDDGCQQHTVVIRKDGSRA